MKDELKIGFIQTNVVWENIDKNLKNFSEKLKQFSGAIDLIILPEMFTTGFTMNSEAMAEEMNGKTMQWMKKMAIEKKSVIVGSLIIKEGNKFYNRLIWMPPDSPHEYYDKRHLFRMRNEHHSYSGGTRKLIVNCNCWNIMPLICYDLRFPVWSRNQQDYDLLIYIANWPESRKEVWEILLPARAIENQVFLIGVNRIGRDAKDLSYSGDSMVINPIGQIISKTKAYEESVETITLSLKELKDFRKKFPVAMDADDFTIIF